MTIEESNPGTGPLIGEMSFTAFPTDPAKTAFVEAVVTAMKSGIVDLAIDLSGYGEGGWHEGATNLDTDDAYTVALAAWYMHCRVPLPPSWLLIQEAGMWDKGLVGRTPHAPDPVLDEVERIESRLRGYAWTRETTADARLYDSVGNIRKETGQCAVTALVVQDALGGDLLRVELPQGSITTYGRAAGGGSHYFNRLPDGRVIDLTRGQFSTFKPVGPPEVRTREYVLSNPDTKSRYDILLENIHLDA